MVSNAARSELLPELVRQLEDVPLPLTSAKFRRGAVSEGRSVAALLAALSMLAQDRLESGGVHCDAIIPGTEVRNDGKPHLVGVSFDF